MEEAPHSNHYTAVKPEPIEVTEAWNLPYHLGNAIKYVARHNRKGSPIADLEKAEWFIRRYRELLQQGKIDAQADPST